MKIKKLIFLILFSTCFSKQLRFLEEISNGKAIKTAAEVASDLSQGINLIKQEEDINIMFYIGLIIDYFQTIDIRYYILPRSLRNIINEFAKLNETMEYDFYIGYRQGINNEGLEFFMQEIFDYSSIPENYNKDFNESLHFSNSRKMSLVDYNFVFNKKENKNDPEKKDYLSYINILIFKYFDKKTHIKKFSAIVINAESKAKFLLDELVYKTSEKVLRENSKLLTFYSECQNNKSLELQEILRDIQVVSLKELFKKAGIKYEDYILK